MRVHGRNGPNRVTIRTAQQVIEKRRQTLQEASCPLGLRLFAEKPAAFKRRLEDWWSAAKQAARLGDERRQGK